MLKVKSPLQVARLLDPTLTIPRLLLGLVAETMIEKCNPRSYIRLF